MKRTILVLSREAEADAERVCVQLTGDAQADEAAATEAYQRASWAGSAVYLLGRAGCAGTAACLAERFLADGVFLVLGGGGTDGNLHRAVVNAFAIVCPLGVYVADGADRREKIAARRIFLGAGSAEKRFFLPDGKNDADECAFSVFDPVKIRKSLAR